MTTYQTLMSIIGHYLGILLIITNILAIGEKWFGNQSQRHPNDTRWLRYRGWFEDANDLVQLLSVNLRNMIKGDPPPRDVWTDEQRDKANQEPK